MITSIFPAEIAPIHDLLEQALAEDPKTDSFGKAIFEINQFLYQNPDTKHAPLIGNWLLCYTRSWWEQKLERGLPPFNEFGDDVDAAQQCVLAFAMLGRIVKEIVQARPELNEAFDPWRRTLLKWAKTCDRDLDFLETISKPLTDLTVGTKVGHMPIGLIPNNSATFCRIGSGSRDTFVTKPTSVRRPSVGPGAVGLWAAGLPLSPRGVGYATYTRSVRPPHAPRVDHSLYPDTNVAVALR